MYCMILRYMFKMELGVGWFERVIPVVFWDSVVMVMKCFFFGGGDDDDDALFK